MKQPLNKALREYYSQEISEEQLHSLNQASIRNTKKHLQWAFSGGLGFVVAAVLLSFVFNTAHEPLSLRIAKEVSYNHSKQMPSEVISSDYAQVGSSLDRLGFLVKESKRLDQTYALIGGRYCSIQGHIAAQLKLQASNNSQDLTLFQFKVPKEFSLSSEIHTELVKGVEVKIWQESGIGFALARTLD